MAKFVCQAGPDAGHEYPVNSSRTVFGRRSGCEVQIMDSMASREHFEVRKVGDLYTLVDLESRNGTKVNGRKVIERQLDFNDRVRVGEVEWVFIKEDGDVDLSDLLTSKYDITEKVGEGGMGVVYKAIQRSMDRTVALKVLAGKYAARPKYVQRFIDEARAAGRLNHPNIIQVHDVDTENGIHYFSMEFVDGGTCSQLLKANGPFPLDQALEITRLVAKALQYAHDNRLIHRDVKPDNIMVSSANMIKLADLGISKSFDDAENEERPKKIAGTPHYMAPEAIQGKKIDHRVDMYGLGATLYHMLAGKTPFARKSASAVLKAHVNETAAPLTQMRQDIPQNVSNIVSRMMEKDPNDRYPTMADLIETIEGAQKAGDMGAALPKTGDTMMLRRFAAGNDSGTRVGHSTKGSASRSASASESRQFQVSNSASSHLGSLFKWAAVIVVLIIGGLLAVSIINELELNKKDDQSTQTAQESQTTDVVGSTTDTAQNNQPLSPTQSVENSSPANDAPIQVAPTIEDLRMDQFGALRRLQERLSASPDDDMLREIDSELMAIEDAPIDTTIADMCGELRSELDQVIKGRLEAAEAERLRLLRDDVKRMALEHDYDAALRRLEGFNTQNNSDAKRIIESMIANVQLDRDSFISELSTRIQYAITRDDGDTLRIIRDEQLPRSMLDSELARSIDQALLAIDQAALNAHREHLDELSALLANWDLTGFNAKREDLHEQLSTGPEANSYQELTELGAGLNQFVNELHDVLAVQGKYGRYRGTLGGTLNPDIVDIQCPSLVLRVTSGGQARVLLRNIDTATFKAIIQLTLGDAGLATYGPMIEAYEQLSL